MIESVSTFSRSMTIAVPRTVETARISADLWSASSRTSVELRWMREPADDGRRRRDRRRHQMRPPAGALTALEVPVRRRGAALARTQDVGIHPQAHRAARGAPLEPRLAEHAIEALALRVLLHPHRAGDDERADPRADAPPLKHDRRRAQVLEPRVRARTDEHRVDRDLAHRRPR